MYSQRQLSQLTQEFWTALGQYMSPVLNADGEKINWVNYKTGIRFIHVKMEAGSKLSVICIELSHPDATTRQLHFTQFLRQQQLFESLAGRSWEWLPQLINASGKEVAVIQKSTGEANVFDKTTWPILIGFFKPALIAFDEFWQMAKYGF